MATNTDIRIAVGFPDHWKIEQLMLELGPQGCWSWLTLLCRVGANRPTGSLAGMKPMQIKIAAKWPGDPQQFIDKLVEIGLLDDTPEGLVVHDWPEHNPYAVTAPERSERARKAAAARWEKERAEHGEDDIPIDATSMRVASISNAPSPSPSPDPYPPPEPHTEAARVEPVFDKGYDPGLVRETVNLFADLGYAMPEKAQLDPFFFKRLVENDILPRCVDAKTGYTATYETYIREIVLPTIRACPSEHRRTYQTWTQELTYALSGSRKAGCFVDRWINTRAPDNGRAGSVNASMAQLVTEHGDGVVYSPGPEEARRVLRGERGA